MSEIWKPVKYYEELYEVSNTGKVRSTNYMHTCKVKELSQGNTRGYLRVGLYKEGKRKFFQVHRLVVQAFIGEIPKGLIVNHKDENKHNNNVNNLEICTVKYNNNFGTRNERAAKNISVAMKGKIPWIKGKKHTQETRAKISANRRGIIRKVSSIS